MRYETESIVIWSWPQFIFSLDNDTPELSDYTIKILKGNGGNPI